MHGLETMAKLNREAVAAAQKTKRATVIGEVRRELAYYETKGAKNDHDHGKIEALTWVLRMLEG